MSCECDCRDGKEPSSEEGSARARCRPPEPVEPPTTLDLSVGGLARAQVLILAVNVLTAVFFAVVQSDRFLHCLLYTNAVGFSMFWLNWSLHRVQRRNVLHWKTTLFAIPAGSVLGFAVARLVESGGVGGPFLERTALAASLAGGLVFGLGVAYYFQVRAKAVEADARLREELLQRAQCELECEQQLARAELKTLQAQIEPHFLFNTLSNVLQLVDSDLPGAKRMLLNLTSYLRGSLHRTRAGTTTLGEELDLVRAYLEIQAERMGARLAWCIECPAELRGLPLPPLLLQPLVENAVRHGLEPRPGGGEVRVLARREQAELVLDVQDTGAGIGPGSGSGVGLANVRARVRAVSGGQGSMVIQPRSPHGVCVRIALPLAGAPVAAGSAP